MMSGESCGSLFLLALPEDVFVIVCEFLSPVDVCSLGLCCRSLYDLVGNDKVWLVQCEKVGVLLDYDDIVEWRNGVLSYKALCRFLVTVRALLGLWVHQNPELGNVVYVMPGFLSVVGCRIIPQEIGPLGIEEGPLLWSLVFEVVADVDGSSVFFLHGREKGNDYLYPGSVKGVDKSCNVLLLEVEPRLQETGGKLLHSKSVAQYCSDVEHSRNVSRFYSGLSKSQRFTGRSEERVSFGKLSFSDRRRLLEIVTSQVRFKLPDSANGPLFSRLRGGENFKKDVALLYERRQLLMQMCQLGGGSIDWKKNPKLEPDSSLSDLSSSRSSIDHLNGFVGEDDCHMESTKKKTITGYFRDSIKQIFGRSSSIGGTHSTSNSSSSSSESKYAQLYQFLGSGDTIGLTLHACNKKLSSYRAWPNMHESRFALYKLPLRVATADQEFAGLWGGTFGWPPGKPSKDKPGQALFLLSLSYEQCQGQQLLIATKILEGTHYVVHPNGSAMFIANIDEPSLEQFPWDTDADSNPVIVKNAFIGDGITNGYGFRYPGSKPGSLFVIENGLLVFLWKDSRAVLTLNRLSLQELLKKGDRVPALPPTANFSYLTKSYSNVFTGFPSTSACLSSPR